MPIDHPLGQGTYMLVQNMKFIHQRQDGLHSHEIQVYIHVSLDLVIRSVLIDELCLV